MSTWKNDIKVQYLYDKGARLTLLFFTFSVDFFSWFSFLIFCHNMFQILKLHQNIAKLLICHSLQCYHCLLLRFFCCCCCSLKKISEKLSSWGHHRHQNCNLTIYFWSPTHYKNNELVLVFWFWSNIVGAGSRLEVRRLGEYQSFVT